MNTPAYFEIQADDVARASAFYNAVFGWKFIRAEGTPVEYWRIETATPATSGMRGGILKRPVARPSEVGGTNAFTVSMEIANFDATAATIMAHGGVVAMAKFAVPGTCWQGYFLDTEGNVFGLFQVDPAAK